MLGKPFGILINVSDVAASSAFYRQFGFKPQGEVSSESAVLTDGALTFYLFKRDFVSPVGRKELLFSHLAPEAVVQVLKEAGVEYNAASEHPLFGVTLTFRDPNGHTIRIVPSDKPLMDVESEVPAGKFGEYSIPTKDFAASKEFWTKLGFASTMESEQPYPWGMFVDGPFQIGLHQTNENDPTVYPHFKNAAPTYFTGDMDKRIAKFKAEGASFVSLSPGGEDKPEANGIAIDPDGEPLFLFYWGEAGC